MKGLKGAQLLVAAELLVGLEEIPIAAAGQFASIIIGSFGG